MVLQEFTGHQPAARRGGQYGRPFVVIAMIGSRAKPGALIRATGRRCDSILGGCPTIPFWPIWS